MDISFGGPPFNPIQGISKASRDIVRGGQASGGEQTA